MKKIIIGFSTFLLLLITFSFNIFADDFVLRNDIKFGDSVETVKEKETLEIDEDEERVDENDESIKYIETQEGEVANIPGCIITYTFKDDKLIDMKYEFEFASLYLDNSELVDKTLTAFETLEKKYGLIFDRDNIDDSYFKTSLYDTYLHCLDRIDKGKSIEIVNYNGCLVNDDSNNYGVKIETLSYISTSDFGSLFAPYIEYRYISPDEMKEYNEKVEDYNNSLDNDL